MTEKSIPEQLIDDFIEKLPKSEILKKESLEKLKDVLNSDNPTKQKILNVIKE